jgi:RNA-directed DNA polymerase
MMDGRGKSDGPVVPVKPPNNARTDGAAEGVEGRGPAKGNSAQRNALRTQSRAGAPSALDRVREVARRDKKVRFTALLHHVDVERLRRAYFGLKRHAAPGVDGVTWQEYGESLEANLQDLCDRVQRGAYRAKPSRRTYIPKADGRQRPLGIAALEDKVVQRAVVEVLNAIYETDFLGFSYGFRPGRSQHHALDALTVALEQRKVNWVLDADIRDFFGTIKHEWLVKFVEHRIADKRVVRLIQKWLAAGVMEAGRWTACEEGTPQGATVSPVLANLYLHHVLDLWVQHWRKRQAHGETVIVRYADDFAMGFQYREDAERLLVDLRERFAKFGLQLHPDKTRLFEFGRFAARDRAGRGDGKPETFNFLGFTHICAKTRNAKFCVLRQTMRKRMTAKLGEVKTELRQRRHDPIPEQGAWLGSIVRGYFAYHAVPRNQPALQTFRHQIGRLWWQALRRRSQTDRTTAERLRKLVHRYLPPVRILHAYPNQRLSVRTQGGSRMR